MAFNDDEQRLARLTMLRADALARGHKDLAIVYGWSVIEAIAAVVEANITKIDELRGVRLKAGLIPKIVGWEKYHAR